MARPKTTLGRGATGLPRFYMDVAWWQSPSWVGETGGPSAVTVGVRTAMQSYCTRYSTDGRVPGSPTALAKVLGFTPAECRRAIQEMVDRGRIAEAAGGKQWQIVGYTDHNPTRQEVEEYQAERSESGRRGNHQRWHVERGVYEPSCEYCAETPPPSPDRPPPDPERDRSSDTLGIADASHGIGRDGIGRDRTPTHVSSKTHADGRPQRPVDEDEDPMIDAAWHLIARRRSDHAGGKNPSWRRTVARNLPTDEHHPGTTYAAQARWLLATWQVDDPKTLADLLTGARRPDTLNRRPQTLCDHCGRPASAHPHGTDRCPPIPGLNLDPGAAA